ncbi:MAG: TolC family protein [Saprospiraceae bacterium]
MRNALVRIFLLLFLTTSLLGQVPESQEVFPLDQYLDWVRQYHPVIRQANLLENQGDARILESRGIFDPKWFGEYEDKTFDEKNYFRIGEAGLKIPTWFGADVKLGYLWTDGQFLNPENSLPANGQAVVGVELNLMQGLLFDQRRAQVRQARLLRDMNLQERRAIVNEVILDASIAYWNWAYQYQVMQIYTTALELSENRFTMVKESFLQGDKPAIDTLEAVIQVQTRSIQLEQSRIDVQNKRLELSNYLWMKDLTPLEVREDLLPENFSPNTVVGVEEPSESFLNNLIQTHPELTQITLKQDQLDIKEKLKREQFKPQLRVNYNFLGDGFDWRGPDAEGNGINNLFAENYKWGLTFSYPLLLRKERAGLELVQLEQLETEYKLRNKELQLTNKINAIYQELDLTENQLRTTRSMVDNYQTLFEAETLKFRIGESSVFLLNSREQKLMEAQIKLQKLEAELEKLKYKLLWARGELR